jgi:hypothetical protein
VVDAKGTVHVGMRAIVTVIGHSPAIFLLYYLMY